jgi:hypothetical protein
MPRQSDSSRCDHPTILGEQYRSIKILRNLSSGQAIHSPISYNVLLLAGHLST